MTMSIKSVLDIRQREHADVLQGQIARDASGKFRNDDGSYNVRLIRSQAVVRATKANPSEEYAPDTWVDLANLGASGLQLGGGYSILRRSAGEKAGISGVPLSTSHGRSATVIFEVDPMPAELVQGGAAVAQYIRGVNLSEEPEYSSAEIVDDVPPIVTSTAITSSIRATASAPLGLHDLTLHDQTIPGAINVVAAEEAEPVMLWVANGNGSLFRVNADTLAVEATYTLTTPQMPVGLTAFALSVGTDTLVFYRALNTFSRINTVSGVRDVHDEARLTATADTDLISAQPLGSNMYTTGDGSIVIGPDIARRLISCQTNGSSEDYVNVDATAPVTAPLGVEMDDDGAYVTWIAIGQKLWRMADNANVSIGENVTRVRADRSIYNTPDFTHVWIGSVNSKIYKVRKSDLVVLGNFAPGGVRDFRLYDSYVVALVIDGGSTKLKRYDHATLAFVDSVTLDATTDGRDLFILEGTAYVTAAPSGNVYVVDLATMTVTDSATVDPDAVGLYSIVAI